MEINIDSKKMAPKESKNNPKIESKNESQINPTLLSLSVQRS